MVTVNNESPVFLIWDGDPTAVWHSYCWTSKNWTHTLHTVVDFKNWTAPLTPTCDVQNTWLKNLTNFVAYFMVTVLWRSFRCGARPTKSRLLLLDFKLIATLTCVIQNVDVLKNLNSVAYFTVTVLYCSSFLF